MEYQQQDGSNAGMQGGMTGSTYLRGADMEQMIDSVEDNWEAVSEESEPEDFRDCQERQEFEFDNGARYKGQWKENVRHGKGI